MQGRRPSTQKHSGADEGPSTSAAKEQPPSTANKTKVTQQELNTVFQKFDPSRSGFVNLKKLKLVMRALGFDCRAAEIDRLTDEMQGDEAARAVCEDAFSAEELAHALEDRLATAEEETKSEVQGAFRLFDVDIKGYINTEDLRRVADELGEHIKDEELQEMIDEADSEKRGHVSEADFSAVMKKTGLY